MQKKYFVPDLSPKFHPEIKGFRPRWIFVAESPHNHEIEPVQIKDRRPLCGVAGKQWWSMLSEILEGAPNPDVSLDRLLGFCKRHQIAVMNAVQYPLDPKIVRRFPEADPILTLGFAKTTGENSFKKKIKSVSAQKVVGSLRDRLTDPSVIRSPIVCLGNDAEWFVRQALGSELFASRVVDRVPHPSAWWRRQDLFRRIAREKLEKIFTSDVSRSALISR